MKLKYAKFLYIVLIVVLLVPAAFQPQMSVYAAVTTVTPITWNIIGLDSNNPSVGPNLFPVGARVCANAAGSITVDFVWDDGAGIFKSSPGADPYINLRDGTNSSVTLVFAGSGCQDAYFEVEVNRNSNAYNNVRRYHITAGGISTPIPRELFVEHLISQSRNSVTNIQYGPHNGALADVAAGGTMTLLVGQEYDIKVYGSTATNGYEQSETFISLPNKIFQILSVSSTYTADTSVNVPSPNDKLYGDACNAWEANPLSPNYPSCQSTGKVGGDITETYHVKILSVPGAPLVNPEPLGTLIYDYSGSSFHYNADFGVSTRFAYIVDYSSLGFKKKFTPASIEPNGVSQLKFTLTNPFNISLNGVQFNDTLPTTPGNMVVAPAVNLTGTVTTNGTTAVLGSGTAFTTALQAGNVVYVNGATRTVVTITDDTHLTLDSSVTAGSGLTMSAVHATTVGCGTPTFSPAAGAASLSFTSGTLYPNSTCTITVPVTAPTASATAYANTSGYLYLNNGSTNTNLQATANLTVGTLFTKPSVGSTCTPDATPLAAWNFENAGAPSTPSSFSTKVDPSSAYTYASITATSPSVSTTQWAGGGGSGHSWTGTGWATGTGVPAITAPYYQFSVDTRKYAYVRITFSMELTGNNDWKSATNDIYVYSSKDDGASFTATNAASYGVKKGPADNTNWVTTTAMIAETGTTDNTGNLNTIFRIIPTGNGGTGVAWLDNVTITGCSFPNPPTITKSFLTNPVKVNDTPTLRFTITNPAGNTSSLSGIAFSDDLPDGLDVTSGTSTACTSGTLTLTAASGSTPAKIALTGGGSLAANSSCTIDVTVIAKANKIFSNVSGYISASESGGNTTSSGYATASLTAYLPPQITKTYASNSILTGGTSKLTYVITNPNSFNSLTGINFSDNYLGTMTNVSPLNISTNTCGITPTASGGGTSFAVPSSQNMTLAAGASCTITVDVTATTASTTPVAITSSTTVSATGTSGSPGANGALSLTGNTSSDTLYVRAPKAEITLSKLVASGITGLSGTISSVTTRDVVGSGTSFNTQLAVGDTIYLGTVTSPASPHGYPIVSITDATHLKIAYDAPNYSGAYSASTPWLAKALIPAGKQLYYMFVPENTGDVSLTFTLSDPTVNPSCNWYHYGDGTATTASLPVASSSSDPAAYCIYAPNTPNSGLTQAGYFPNTATVNPSSGSPATDTASYMNGNFGHLPVVDDRTNTSAGNYSGDNIYNSGGAFALNGSVMLGSSVTTTASDGPGTGPSYAYTYANKSTDNGVSWTGTWASGSGQAIVNATCPSGHTCYLYAWVDWNNDGDFNDLVGSDSAPELIYGSTVVNGPNTITVNYPGSGSLTTGTYYTRFRIYDGQPASPSPYGIAKDASGNPMIGEIEDPLLIYNGSGTPTPVTLGYFRAQRQGGVVNFEWSTATEAGNLGFNLYVEDDQGGLTKVNDELILSSVTNSMERQDYTFSAEVDGNKFYIEDVSILGETMKHGPFQLGEKYGEKLDAEPDNQAAIESEHKEKEVAQQNTLKQAITISAAALQPAAAQSNGSSLIFQLTGATLNLAVRQTGLYRVTYEALQNAGLDLKDIPINKIVLMNRGQAQPIYVQGQVKSPVNKFGPGGYIEFYGEALDTLYTDTNIYTVQVSVSAAPRVQENNAAAGRGQAPATSYTETLMVNRQRGYIDYAPGNDPWYETAIQVQRTPNSGEVSFQVNGLVSGAGSMALTLWGGTSSPDINPDHHAIVVLNGVTLMNDKFDGVTERILTMAIPAGVLKEGENKLKIILPGDTGLANETVFLDKFAVTYQRAFQARDGQLTFTAAGKTFSVSNLPSKNIIVYRLDSKGMSKLGQVDVTVSGSTYTALFAGTNESATYVVTVSEKLYTPALVPTRVKANLDVPAQYLIISHPDFIDGIKPVADAHRAEGLSVNIVDVKDVYAQYNYGIFDPQAIQKYIAYAATNLGTRYVLLVGGDTYDYRNRVSSQSISFIPSLYTPTGQLVRYAPVDPLYTDLNADHIPDLAIGRFPVRRNIELARMVSKTLAYQSKNYGRTAVFASDLYDGIESYKNINASQMANMPANWAVENVNMDEMSLQSARQKLIAAMNRGSALITYTGHSGYLQWSFSNLFTINDALSLTNHGRPFVAVQWGCYSNYYITSTGTLMLQSMLFSGDQGAVLTLGSVNLTDSGSERLLGEHLTSRLVTPGMTVGQAVVDAKKELAQMHPELLDVILGWTIMGDPALVIEP